MIIARLSGGIGNQLFQYALGRNLSFKNDVELKIEISDFDDPKNTRIYKLGAFNINAILANNNDLKEIGLPDMKSKNFLGRIIRKIFRIFDGGKLIHKRKFVIEPRFQFCPDILKIENSCYLSGVWQSEKYFKDIEKVIRKEFTLKNKPSVGAENWIGKVRECDSVSIHIRRGDYVNSPKTNQFHGVCSLKYYNEAIALIVQKIANPVFFVFSDDIAWARANLKTRYSIEYVSDKKIPDYEELIIMSRCKHNILANSSFSWWGAWLNENPDKIVIAPKKWFVGNTDTTDLIPASWIRL
ncbi:MAG: alpha-1,2-fucosyltransferase [Minisyncoccota bacterium]